MHYTKQPFVEKADLKHGAYYEGHCRNAQVARWNAEKTVFVHWRTKFNDTFLEEIRHPDDDKVYDVFRPWGEVDAPEREIPLKD